MTEPKRIQRKRTAGWRMPEGATYVGRPTKWGNQFRVGRDAISPYHLDSGWVDLSNPGVRIYPFDEATWRAANPQRPMRCETVKQAVEWFRVTLPNWMRNEARAQLAGKDLACWCPLDRPCHADVLLEIANGGAQ